ncbi:MAG: response regulator [Clostridia bacterium]
MKLIYVDDEQGSHINFAFSIEDRTDISSVMHFTNAQKCLDYAKSNKIDCAILDINLGMSSGIDLAKTLKEIHPHIEIIFITSYDEFAREAFRVGARGYLSKPYSTDELDEVLSRVSKLIKYTDKPTVQLFNTELSKDTPHIFARTFGNFDLLIDGNTVHFKNAKAKELLAFLINQIGGTVSNAQIFFALWERQEYSSTTSTYVRRTIRSLKDELTSHKIEHILISQRNSICIDANSIECDYYSLLNGDKQFLRTFNDQYMAQYSWAEETTPIITRMSENLQSQ